MAAAAVETAVDEIKTTTNRVAGVEVVDPVGQANKAVETQTRTSARAGGNSTTGTRRRRTVDPYLHRLGRK